MPRTGGCNKLYLLACSTEPIQFATEQVLRDVDGPRQKLMLLTLCRALRSDFITELVLYCTHGSWSCTLLE